MDTLPYPLDIGILYALLYGLAVILIARRYEISHAPAHVGTTTSVTYVDTGEPVPSTPLTPHEKRLWEERVAPYRDGVPHPHSPAHYYQALVGTKHTHADINMDDPDWVRLLEEKLS